MSDGPQQPRRQEPQAVAGVPRLFVGQVPVDKQEEDLIPLFSAFGKVEKLSVVRGPDRKSRGCAMIQFERWADAEAALEATNGTSPFDGEDTKQLMVTFANPRRPGPVPVNETAIAPRKLFVTRIPKDTTPERLRDLFGQFGIVEQATIVPGKGPHGGCAFVRLSKWASCEAAIDALNEKHVMEGCKLPLMVKFAEARRGDGLGVPITKRGSGGSTSSSANGSVGSTSTRLQSPMHPGFMQYGHPMYSHNYVDGGDMAVVMGHPPGMHYAPYGGLPGVPGLLNPRRRDGQPAIGSGSSGRRALGSTDGGSTDSLVDNSSDASESQPGTSSGPSSTTGPTPNFVHLYHPDIMHMQHLQSAGHHMQAMAAAGMIASYMTPDGHFLAAPFMPPMQPQGATKLGLGVTDPSVYAHKLFVGQVPFDATEYDLWQLFAPCGDILELTILRKSGMSKGCAFLTYATRRQAIDAITAHHGRDLTDSKRLVVKFADHKPAPASAPAPAVSES